MRPEVHPADRRLAGKATLMMSGTLVGAGFGFVFWVAAARLLPPEAVGAAGALISAAGLIAMLAECGLGTLLVERLLTVGNGGALVTACLASVVLAALGLAVTALALAGSAAATGLPVPLWSVASAAWLPALATATALGSVCDQACCGVLRTGLALERNLVASGGKLALLLGLAGWCVLSSQDAIIASWALGLAASLAWLALRVGRPPDYHGTGFHVGRADAARLAGHHSLNVAASIAPLAIPIIASQVLGNAIAAPFYVAWLIAGTAFMAPSSLASVLLAVGNGDPDQLADRFRFSLRTSLALAAATTAALPVLGPLVLSLFGSRYGSAASHLALLGAAALPCAFRHHLIALRRFEGRMIQAALFFAAGASAEVAFATLGAAMFGATGLCLGWVTAVWAQGALCLSPVIAATHRDPETATAGGTAA